MSIVMSRHPPVGTFRPHGSVDVAVVLMSHNSADDLPAILGSLRREARDIAMRVVVADNSSSEASLSVAAAHTDVVAVPTGCNLGYAGGINVAMGRVGAVEAGLVLKPDVRIGPGAITALLQRLGSDPRIGVMVVLHILDDAGRTSFSLRREPTLMRALDDALISRHWPGRPADALSEQERHPAVYDTSATTDWATGAVLLVAAEVATHVGSWDERFFLYSEEVDFLHRVRREGWMVVYEPAAKVTHRDCGSGVSDELVALTLVNKVR